MIKIALLTMGILGIYAYFLIILMLIAAVYATAYVAVSLVRRAL